jgi:hypothetical protein
MLPEQRNKLREQLIEKQRSGLLGVVAAKSSVPEWVLRDWCSNPMNTPTLVEMQKAQDAIDNKKRLAPLNSDAAAVGIEPPFP